MYLKHCGLFKYSWRIFRTVSQHKLHFIYFCGIWYFAICWRCHLLLVSVYRKVCIVFYFVNKSEFYTPVIAACYQNNVPSSPFSVHQNYSVFSSAMKIQPECRRFSWRIYVQLFWLLSASETYRLQKIRMENESQRVILNPFSHDDRSIESYAPCAQFFEWHPTINNNLPYGPRGICKFQYSIARCSTPNQLNWNMTSSNNMHRILVLWILIRVDL